MCVQSFSRVPLFAPPWTEAHQAPLSMEFSRQEYWSELPFPIYSRGSSQPRTRIHVSCIFCIGRQILAEPPGIPLVNAYWPTKLRLSWATTSSLCASVSSPVKWSTSSFFPWGSKARVARFIHTLKVLCRILLSPWAL